LATISDGLACRWFGGSLEGKADMCIYRSVFGADGWGEAERLSDAPILSEQNPVQFETPDGRTLILHTAQPGDDQDACIIRMRQAGSAPTDLPLPRGTFIRALDRVRDDGACLLPLFRCISQGGYRWIGSDDTAAMAIREDADRT
jgi:predicted neuraminidase